MKQPSAAFRRSPIWPALLSALVAPGIGQFFNREFGKGIFLLGSTLLSFAWFSKVLTEQLSLVLPGTPDQWAANQAAVRDAVMKLIGQNGEMFMTFEILMILIWSFSVADAYFTARKQLRSGSVQGGDQNGRGNDENSNTER